MVIRDPGEVPYCVESGCRRKACFKHYNGKGERVYRTKCNYHRKGTETRASDIPPADCCELCSWRGSVHRHRMVERGPYSAENVKHLCPNCHTAMHGHGVLNQPQVYTE